MLIKIQPDIEKSKALEKMAKITLQRLNEIDVEKYPSNTLNDYYDIIHKLMEAHTLRKGVKIKGEGAHKELIEHVSNELQLSEKDRLFLQKMRDYRNRIAYEGFFIHKNFIKLNKEKIIKIINHLSS